jgi:hypothetical protein
MPVLLLSQMILRSGLSRESARRSFEMMTLEAVVGFVNRTTTTDKAARWSKYRRRRKSSRRRGLDMTANDRRFLRSLRIASDEQPEEEVEAVSG